MTLAYRLVAALVLPLIWLTPTFAQKPPVKPATPEEKLAMCGLAPSKLAPNLCLLKYRVRTSSPDCQAFFDQGLGYFYSYVWMEAARSFETAARLDPSCAMAWWGLARSLERWGKSGQVQPALQKAQELMPRASQNEQMLITASLQLKGLVAGVGDQEARKKAAVQTLDNLLALYDDDQEAWNFRAELAGGTGFGGIVSAVPFYKSLLRVNPLHPGANHELVHYYEKAQRPALGWIYAEKYIESSPGIPHPFHMQAHLATRIGKWDRTCDRSARAIELERAYHAAMNVNPKEDSQYPHHLEILMISLIHDGRFREAREIKAEAVRLGYRHWGHWFRLHLAERDWTEALKIADLSQKTDKVTASYQTALVYLRQGEPSRVKAAVEVLQEAFQKRKTDRVLEDRIQETQGLLMCQTGDPDAGLKLLAKCAERTKDNFAHHAWGNGAYYMEAWGIAALQCGRPAIAEEAFLEALAHDPGSVRGAMGMQILCERQGRLEEAQRFAELARKCWRRAEVQTFDAELNWLRQEHHFAERVSAPREVARTVETSNGTPVGNNR